MSRRGLEIRNPVLRLSAIGALRRLPADTRKVIELVLLDLSADAGERAEASWRRRKGVMAAYWKAVSVYARHIARALR